MGYLEVNAEQLGSVTRRRELVRRRPARAARREPKPLLLLHGIDLDDNTIDVKRQRKSFLLPVRKDPDERSCVLSDHDGAQRVLLEAPRAQQLRDVNGALINEKAGGRVNRPSSSRFACSARALRRPQ